ncbi:hypothetical protein BD779DRAFT_1403269, partial [Infundibulicybe gibba]
AGTGTTTTTAASTPPPTTTTTQDKPTTTSNTSTTTTTTPTSTTTAPTSTLPTNTTSQAPPTEPSNPPPQNTPVQPSFSQSVNSDGVTVTVEVTQTGTRPSSAAPSSTTSQAAKSNDDSGLGTGSIVGLSVAGGVAVIGIIGFFIWKLTRKRFNDFDDNEAIKWPELNAHGGAGADSHPLPVHNTGRAGFDTGSEASLSRAPSVSNYTSPSALSHDAGGVAPDPYAVPPFPHLNPNQPYRDDPVAASGYYDPYRGPVPGTIDNGTGGDWGGEAIPMTQMSGNGRMSPGPNAAYNAGRASPGPQAAYAEPVAGRRSPGPQMAYGNGRSSPGPHAAYNTGRASPGPHNAYGGGRASPGPQAAYG